MIKKWMSMLLMVCILATMFPSYSATAASGPGREIKFTKDGDLIIEVTSTKATTGIRYRTTGWMITSSSSCGTYSSTYDCRPMTKSAVITLPKVASVTEDDGTYITSTFTYPRSQLIDEFFAAFHEVYQPNQNLYFSAIMESYESSSGTRRSGPHHTLNGIKYAEPWRFEDDLDEYFDIPVSYNPLQPIEEVLYVVEDGVRTQIGTNKKVGEAHLNESYAHSLPESVTYRGRTVPITRSYIAPKLKPSQEKFVQSVKNNDPRVIDRNIMPSIGGSLVVAEYEVSGIPVKAQFIREDDKTSLLEDEELGEFKEYDPVEYDFKPNEFISKVIGGYTQDFQLVRSYIQNEGGEPKFIQEADDPALYLRSITIGQKPTAFVGEYRMVENPVLAIAMTEDGSVLKRTDKGEHPVGTNVTHTFDETITNSGTEYQIIQSYIVNNRRPGIKTYIQNTGDANLLARSINVGAGGNQIVGIYRGDQEPPGPQPPNSCAVIGSPSKGQVMIESVMDPNASGMLRADNRGAEQFNVEQGIPTSENLFANISALNYLYKHAFANMRGEVTYTVTVTKTYNKTWTEPPSDPDGEAVEMTKTEKVTEEVTVTRPYSYWQIDNLEVYAIDRSTVSNYALGGQGGTVTLEPSGYTAPVLQSSHMSAVEDHVTPAECEPIDLGEETVSGGSSEPPTPSLAAEAEAEAESAIGKNKVRNDRVVFNGTTIMNNADAEESAPDPSAIPAPTQIGSNVLYQNGLTISKTLQNRANNPTTGTIYYNLVPGHIKGGSNTDFAIPRMNDVTVHTPTVVYPTVTDDRTHNQKINPALDRAALILDREFTVFVPTSGQHRSIPGYGNRDYQKYITIKQVYFPFDVYDAETEQFYAKNQWISIPVSQQSKKFFLPVWVDEGFYDVSFRSFAENYPSGFTYQQGANTDLAHHVAVNTVPVDVVGRLYDFRITDIADYNWEQVFRTAKDSAEHSPNVYYVGSRGIDGAAIGNRNMQGQPVGGQQQLTLPIRPGSHTAYPYRNWVIKSGYHFKFEVKTKGNMDGLYDAVRIYPSFSFVKKDGTGRIPVDLYYHDYTNNKYFVKIGSTDDRVERQVVLNDRLRNVPQSTLNDTAQFMASVLGVTDFAARAKKPKAIGRLSWLLLPYEMRTLHGPKTIPSSVSATRALGSMQTWYGQYSLPATVYAVAAGTNIAEYGRTNGGIREDAPIFLKDGYLIVNFNIETIRNRNVEQPYLRYYPLEGDAYPFNNQWAMEGFAYRQDDKSGHTFVLKDGDVAFYHPDKSSNDDFGSSVPH